MDNLTAGNYCYLCNSYSCMHIMMQAQQLISNNDLVRHLAFQATPNIDPHQFIISNGTMTVGDEFSDEKKLLLLL